jgi:hypothetical protein
MHLASDKGLEATDRDVARAATASDSFRKALKTDPTKAEGPLADHRSVAGQQALTALRERQIVSQDAELRDALCRWVAVLTVRRVTEAAEIDEAKAVSERTARLHLDAMQLVSFREAWHGLVAARADKAQNAWLDAAAERGEAVASARREVRARRHEASVRLGFGSWSDLLGGAKDVRTASLAFLKATGDLACAVRREAERTEGEHAGTFTGAVAIAVARDAPDGFPARLTLRTLMDMFATKEPVAKGLRLDVPLPEVVGAASFGRALESFGASFRRAGALSSRTPFALSHDAHFVDAYRFGFVFGALMTDPVFHRRGLGVVARVADRQARILARTALLHARTLALGAVLALDDAPPSKGDFEELTHDVYGKALPAALKGAFPASHLEDDAARIEALLSCLPLMRDLRERFDEDWFRNPHAWRSLRARASAPARVPPEALDAATLARAFEEALG